MASAAVTPARTLPPKEALCFPCALRMSILFRVSPPPSLMHVVESAEYKVRGPHPESEPVTDDSHHPRFTILHETPQSVRRYLDSERPVTPLPSSSLAEGAGMGKGNSCIDGMFGGEDAPRHDVTWLCVGCFGLYQFMDLVHAPAVAAEVRRSRFTDSTAISINVNVNRSFTFTWLTAATRYFDKDGTGTACPRATAVIPEEMCNFKEFFMSDLRFRVLQYLTRPHDEIVSGTATDGKVAAGLETYVRLVSVGLPEEVETQPPASKQPRTENSSAASTSAAAATPSPRPRCPQKFTYTTESDKLVCEVYCRHHPTEQLLLRQLVPQQYCTNKVGVVLTYSVLYEFAQPFLASIGWSAPTDRDTRPEKREAATLSCGLSHANIYLMGNYRKMMRNLSQSPWFANGARVGTFSLQEVIANPVLPFFFPEGVAAPTGGDARAAAGARRDNGQEAEDAAITVGREAITAERGSPSGASDSRRGVNPNLTASGEVFGFGSYKFHSAGREDVDVRMLGTGRPFVLEVVNPTREQFDSSDLRTMEAAINASHNGSVEVFHMRLTDANVTVRLARHSESKIKRYRCVIWCSRAIADAAHDESVRKVNETVDLAIVQKTPVRVLHRRSLHARPRTIHSMKLTPLNAHWFILEVETQAGTYVKEFVHGDMGRTVPNLGQLLNARTDIVQLDVVGMAMQDLDREPNAPASLQLAP